MESWILLVNNRCICLYTVSIANFAQVKLEQSCTQHQAADIVFYNLHLRSY